MTEHNVIDYLRQVYEALAEKDRVTSAAGLGLAVNDFVETFPPLNLKLERTDNEMGQVALSIPLSFGKHNFMELRDITATISGTMREIYKREECLSKEPFAKLGAGGWFTPSPWSSPEGLRWVYDFVEGGLTLRPEEKLETGLLAAIREKGVSSENYQQIRQTCLDFKDKVLAKMWAAGKLDKAFIFVGFHEPEESEFNDSYGSFLTPLTTMETLAGKNTGGGPAELFFRYDIPPCNLHRSVYQEMKVTYDAEKEVLLVEDVGIWKKREDGALIFMKPQPSLETRINENSPLVKIVQSYLS